MKDKQVRRAITFPNNTVYRDPLLATSLLQVAGNSEYSPLPNLHQRIPCLATPMQPTAFTVVTSSPAHYSYDCRCATYSFPPHIAGIHTIPPSAHSLGISHDYAQMTQEQTSPLCRTALSPAGSDILNNPLTDIHNGLLMTAFVYSNGDAQSFNSNSDQTTIQKTVEPKLFRPYQLG